MPTWLCTLSGCSAIEFAEPPNSALPPAPTPSDADPCAPALQDADLHPLHRLLRRG